MADSTPQGVPHDRYVVQEYLSEGGMGAIYIGKKLGAGGFSKSVVLKQLLPEFTSQREFRDLFLREARLSATLDHANIVHTIDLVNAGDDFFIVMEYVPGADLRTLLKKAKRRRSRFSPAAGIYVTRELLSALSYAHNKRSLDGQPLQLIHRDVSPSNILVSEHGEVKLTDFGIAKASTHNSVLYRVKGKLGYMSPEQAKSEPMDHRSDLYSLAVCLYEMVAGERLFVKAGLSTSAEEMYSQPVPLLSRTRPDVPPEFDKVLLKALAVDPRHRYQTASSFQDALLRCAHRAGLMMSTPELAAHLREVCGDTDNWRNSDAEEEEEAVQSANRPGTEVYEAVEGTALIGLEEDMDVAPSRISGPLINERERREQRSRGSMFALDRLRGMELTSLIDLSRQQRPDGAQHRPSGSRPLVDIDDFGRGLEVDANLAHAHGAAQGAALRSLEEELEPMVPSLGPAAPAGPGWSAPQHAIAHQAIPHQAAAHQGAAHPGAAHQAAAHPGAMPMSMPMPGMTAPAAPDTRAHAYHPAKEQRRDPGRPYEGPKKRRISRLVLILSVVLLIVIGVTAAVLIGLSGPDMGDGARPDDVPKSPEDVREPGTSDDDPTPDPAPGATPSPGSDRDSPTP